jgi:hypothetical protein
MLNVNSFNNTISTFKQTNIEESDVEGNTNVIAFEKIEK